MPVTQGGIMMMVCLESFARTMALWDSFAKWWSTSAQGQNFAQILVSSIQAAIYGVQAVLLFSTLLILRGQLKVLNKSTEGALYNMHLQSANSYYALMTANPMVFNALFPGKDPRERIDDNSVKAKYTAFALLRMLDDWHIARAHGSFPRSEKDELWQAWDQGARQTIMDSRYLQ